MDLPVEWHKDHHSGDTIDKIEKASERLFEFSSETFEIIRNFVTLLGSVIILAVYDWRIALAAVMVSLMSFFSSLKFDDKLNIGYKKIFKAENFLAAGLYDYIANILTIITLRLKPKAAKEVDKRSMRAFEAFNKNSVINEIKWFIISFSISLMIFGVLSFNAYYSYKTRGMILAGTLFILYRQAFWLVQRYIDCWKEGS